MAKPKMEVIVTALHCTLREWYAGLAMQGLLASLGSERTIVAENVVSAASMYADALIAELAKEEKP